MVHINPVRRCFLMLLCTALPAAAWSQPSPGSIDFQEMTRALTGSLAVEPGERVLLVGAPGRFDALVPMLRQAVEAAGGESLGAWSVTGTSPSSWSTPFTSRIAATQPDDLPALLTGVDASIMLPGATPGHAVYAAIQQVLRGGNGRTIHFHWEGAYGFDGNPLPIDDAMSRLYMRALTATDYAGLAAMQSEFERAMRGSTVRVTTPAGTDLTFEIGDRPVNLQDGDASPEKTGKGVVLVDREIELPAGAIRVAPLEETVNGTIVFPPANWRGGRATGVSLDIERGVVTRVSAETGKDAVLAEMEAAGSAGRAFREFALGFNPLLAIPETGRRWIPYYGYGAGVVRLSLGDNSELGGNVGGGYVRWNFFVDATVTVDDVVWVRNGRMTR